jgi:hypothetical protein
MEDEELEPSRNLNISHCYAGNISERVIGMDNQFSIGASSLCFAPTGNLG